MRKISLLFLLLGITGRLFAQGTFSGDLMTNLNYYMKDTNIRAANNPLYDNALSGGEAWLSLRYNVSGFTFFLRADAFQNSNLKNPTQPSTDFGIGAWNITKDLKNLSITIGSIYDQIGSGIVFRSYEDRGLLIDNALMGLQIKYKPFDNVSIKGFGGQIKNNNAILVNTALHTPPYAPVVKGLNAEGDFSAGAVRLTPGIGFLNRTLDNDDMKAVQGSIQALDSNLRFLPRYNMYTASVYNTLIYKNFSWYIEGAYKTHEAINIPDSAGNNLLADRAGNIVYTTLNYGKKGIAVTLSGKRTENFVMRTSPQETLLRGMLNWQPVVAILRPWRLMSRFSPPSQDVSETAGSANAVISPNDLMNITLSYTHINKNDGTKLYREGYAEIFYQGKKWSVQGGAQYLEYNAYIYQVAPYKKDHPILYAVTPFAELTFNVTEKKSLHMDLQYMASSQDYGSWAYVLLEYDIAPKWAFGVSDMYNVSVNRNNDNPIPSLRGNSTQNGNHYYNIYAAYTKNASRLQISYVKQVDGINCTGGVCRYEPAFSGVKAMLTTSF